MASQWTVECGVQIHKFPYFPYCIRLSIMKFPEKFFFYKTVLSEQSLKWFEKDKCRFQSLHCLVVTDLANYNLEGIIMMSTHDHQSVKNHIHACTNRHVVLAIYKCTCV